MSGENEKIENVGEGLGEDQVTEDLELKGKFTVEF
jgi:hypothetical protein